MGAPALGLAALAIAAGCHRGQPDLQERRRALLQPVDVKHDLQEQRQKQQIFDTDGTLLPSDQIVAGIVLPRGLSLYAASAHDWDFKTIHVASAALERYFAPRLLSSGVSHSLAGSVTFETARPKDDPKAPRVTLRIVKLLGSADASEVFIHQAAPGKPRPSAAEAEAQIRAQRAHAE